MQNAISKIEIGQFVSQKIEVEKGISSGLLHIAFTIQNNYTYSIVKVEQEVLRYMGVPIGDGSQDTIYTLLFTDDQVLITQEYEDMEFIVRKLLEDMKSEV